MTNSYRTILVTGSSGSLGKQLLYELSQTDARPIAHLRPSSDSSFVDSLNLEKRHADLRIRPELAALVDGVDAVVHTAAKIDFGREKLTEFTGINTIGAVDLYRAAAKAGVKRFVHVSSVAAVAGRPRTENGTARNSPPRSNEATEFNLGHLRIPYIMTKRAAEEELCKQAAQGGPELVIVNPSIMMAPSPTGDDRQRMLKTFSRPVMPAFPNLVNLVDVRDVAVGVLKALELGHAGERYILAGDDITVRDLVLAVSDLVGRTPHLMTPPKWVTRAFARSSLIWGRLKGSSRISYYPDLVKLTDYDWSFSSIKAREELGYTPRSIFISLKDLLTENFTKSYARP